MGVEFCGKRGENERIFEGEIQVADSLVTENQVVMENAK